MTTTMPEQSEQQVAMLGVPFDAFSSFLRGPAGAPTAIRRVLHSGVSNLTAENGLDLGGSERFFDDGDVPCENNANDLPLITSRIDSLLEERRRVMSIGGDHTISYPILQGYAKHYESLTILHLDAHPDLYDELDGNRLSHACPFARIMEEGLATRLVQVGIRTMNAHQQAQAERFGVEVHPMNRWDPKTDLRLTGPLYLSIDLDALDPAYAPGVSHHEPGGLSVREVIQLIQDIRVPVVGADIVEYNPQRDVHDMTAAVCLKLIKEVAARMAEQR